MGPPDTQVKLSWQSSPSPDSIESMRFTIEEFKNFFKAGSDEKNHDYAILRIPELCNKKLYNFTVASHKASMISDEILILGFPLEHKNLVCHKGIISSFYITNGVEIIQLDASVNVSNSGGPLVNIITGHVIGIVTRKNTGLSKLFEELLVNFDQNINFLKKLRGGMSFGSMDIMDPFILSQNQMKMITKEIERSANVGIGYAFSIEQIEAEIKLLET